MKLQVIISIGSLTMQNINLRIRSQFLDLYCDIAFAQATLCILDAYSKFQCHSPAAVIESLF